MNTGVIVSRYASALLRFTEETGSGERVCRQIRQLLSNPDAAPEKYEPELERFLALLVKNGRMEDVKLIFHAFVEMYCESQGIKFARLTLAVPSRDTEAKLTELLERQTGSKVILETETDPNILGGFVLEIDNKLLDASISRQIEIIRRQFITQNNRIV